MKKIVVLIALALSVFSAKAQYFDFASNSGRVEAGFVLGQPAYSTEYDRFGLGANVCIWGFVLDFLVAEPEHRYYRVISDTVWDDTKALTINAGYQIPILSWLRLTPMAGYTQTNYGTTDGRSVEYDTDDISWYHRYRVTPGSRTHYFNFGGGLSIQPCKWFSINAVATRYAIYGGISLNLAAFAEPR